jgi:membrane-associated protease RseP (regulator of RpoE activity)
MAKVRGHIVTRSPPGERGWVVKGSDLIAWDSARAIYARKPKGGSRKVLPKKTPISKKHVSLQAKPAASAVTVDNKRGKSPLVVQKKEKKSLAVQEKPSQKKIPVPVKKGSAIESPAKGKAVAIAAEKKVSAGKKGVKLGGRSRKTAAPAIIKKEQQVPIPDDIPDRITALTLKKVVTQTQFGIDVGLPQKAIYEITSRKLNVLNPAIIQRIITTLKSYESK